MKYVYGPVNSRRLGFSLGITLTPPKICNLNCVYCQLGSTVKQLNERKEYIPIEEIYNELKLWLENNPEEAKKLSFITFSGSGEPTLNSKIGELIEKIKKITNLPIAVITNSSLLGDSFVRKDILLADLIIPSLDAVTPEVFAKIDRPHQDIKIDQIISGLISLRKEFPGKIWLEVMLIQGINDDLRHIKKLKAVIDEIMPDKIQLNSPVRSTAEPDILPVEKDKLTKIKEILGDRCQIL
jgi:wyosine [tRNA(Phe)-imidazoG37] synthetase (radical SAM superfamily)